MTGPTAADRLRLGAARVAALLEGPGGPRLAWTLRGYRADGLTGDVTAGMALAPLILPLSIGYAAVAGLPPEMGLYASIAPLLAYAVLGSSRPLVIGPDAASASMIAASIAPLAALPDDRVRLAGVLGLLVAGVFLAMRVARVGFLADLLSRPILVGYLAGVGITVAIGQVAKILGGPAIDAALGVLRRVDWSSADLGAVIGATGRAVSVGYVVSSGPAPTPTPQATPAPAPSASAGPSHGPTPTPVVTAPPSIEPTAPPSPSVEPSSPASSSAPPPAEPSPTGLSASPSP